MYEIMSFVLEVCAEYTFPNTGQTQKTVLMSEQN